VTFSHFLPRFELLPNRLFLIHKSTTLICGDKRLDAQIRKVGAKVHVFGHTHIDQDMVIKGIRYVQNAFGHPEQRKQPWNMLKPAYEPKMVFAVQNDEKGEVEKEVENDAMDFVEKSDSDDELEYHEVEVAEKKDRKPRKKKGEKEEVRS